MRRTRPTGGWPIRRIQDRRTRAWRLRGGSGTPRIQWRSSARGFSRAACWSRGMRRFAGRWKYRGARRRRWRRTVCRRPAAGSSSSAASTDAIRTSRERLNRGCSRPSAPPPATVSTRAKSRTRSPGSGVICASATTRAIRFRSSSSPGSSPPPCTAGSRPPRSTHPGRSRHCAPRSARGRIPRRSSGGVCGTTRQGLP